MSKPTQPSRARQTALQILHAIDAAQAYADVALRQTLQDSPLDRRDRAFVTECVYGVVRWQGRIDWLLQHVCRHPLEAMTPWIRNILRLGAYQCLWMHRVPQRAAVYEAVALARRFGHAGTAALVNGVLRTLMRQHHTFCPPDPETQPVAHLAVMFSHPEWLVLRWLQRYGWTRTRALCEANNQPAAITLRTNTRRTTTAALSRRLAQEGLAHITASTLHADGLRVRGTDRLDRLPSYQAGLFQVQDEGAMLVAPLCQVQPGQWVLEACAAPGGKTTHLAQLLHDSGQIVALDVQPGRLRLLQDNMRRLQLSCITPIVADAAVALPVRRRFDCILVDAPCSGLGVLRRHPDIKWRKTPADLGRLQATQRHLLQQVQSYLAHDGRLVYSVCSNELEETSDVVTQFLHHHPHLILEAIEPASVPLRLRTAACAGMLDLTPEQGGTDGVFVARFRHPRAS